MPRMCLLIGVSFLPSGVFFPPKSEEDEYVNRAVGSTGKRGHVLGYHPPVFPDVVASRTPPHDEVLCVSAAQSASSEVGEPGVGRQGPV